MQTVKNKNRQSIQVAIRMRPLLLPYEDACAWSTDESSNSIATIPNIPNPLELSPGKINPLLLRDRDLKRRFTDCMQSYSFRYGIIFY